MKEFETKRNFSDPRENCTTQKTPQHLTNAKFQLGRFADKQVFPNFVLALPGD